VGSPSMVRVFRTGHAIASLPRSENVFVSLCSAFASSSQRPRFVCVIPSASHVTDELPSCSTTSGAHTASTDRLRCVRAIVPGSAAAMVHHFPVRCFELTCAISEVAVGRAQEGITFRANWTAILGPIPRETWHVHSRIRYNIPLNNCRKQCKTGSAQFAAGGFPGICGPDLCFHEGSAEQHGEFPQHRSKDRVTGRASGSTRLLESLLLSRPEQSVGSKSTRLFPPRPASSRRPTFALAGLSARPSKCGSTSPAPSKAPGENVYDRDGGSHSDWRCWAGSGLPRQLP